MTAIRKIHWFTSIKRVATASLRLALLFATLPSTTRCQQSRPARELLGEIGQRHFDYRAFVLAEIKKDPSATSLINADLSDCGDFILSLMRQHELDELGETAVSRASERLQNDRTFILEVIKQNSSAFPYLKEKWRNDPAIASLALKHNLSQFSRLGPALASNQSFVLKYLKRRASLFPGVARSLRNQPDFIARAFSINFLVYEHLSAAERELLWRAVPNLKERYKFVKEGLKKFNIEFTARFDSFELLEEIIKNRHNLAAADPRPLAVLLYTKEDYEQAFERNQIEELVKNNYRVVYFETGTDEEISSAILSATREVGQQAEILVLAFHGVPRRMFLSEKETAAESPRQIAAEKTELDLSDEQELLGHNLSDTLAEDSLVILDSCSTGRGKEAGENIANMLKRVFPRASVISPTSRTAPATILFVDNKAVGATFPVGEENTYTRP